MAMTTAKNDCYGACEADRNGCESTPFGDMFVRHTPSGWVVAYVEDGAPTREDGTYATFATRAEAEAEARGETAYSLERLRWVAAGYHRPCDVHNQAFCSTCYDYGDNGKAV